MWPMDCGRRTGRLTIKTHVRGYMFRNRRPKHEVPRAVRLIAVLTLFGAASSLILPPHFTTAGFASVHRLHGSHEIAIDRQRDSRQQSSPVNFNTPVPGCVHVPTGLVGWWPFDGNGNNFQTTNNAAVFGGAAFVPGQVAQALNFDGVDDYAAVNNPSGLNVGAGNGFTIDLWINPADISQQRPLVEWGDGAAQGQGAHLWLAVGNVSGLLYANIRDTSGANHIISSPAGVLTANTHQHVALVYEKTFSVAILYVNGNIVATEAFGTVFTPRTDNDLFFGVRPFPPGERYTGRMDEVEIFNRALSQSEIQGISNAGSAGKCKTRYVTNTNNSGAGSLRQTITDSNNYPGADTIYFNIPGSVFTL